MGIMTGVSDGRSVSDHKQSRFHEPNSKVSLNQELTVLASAGCSDWSISCGDQVQAVFKIESTICRKVWDCQKTGPSWPHLFHDLYTNTVFHFTFKIASEPYNTVKHKPYDWKI